MAPLELAGVLVLPGKHDNSHIYHRGNGHFYHVNRMSDDGSTVYMRCINHGRNHCRGRAIWTAARRLQESPHRCLPDLNYIGVVVARNRILDRCRSGDNATFSRILQEERRRFPRAVQARLTLPRLRTAMYEARRSMFPEIPHSLREVGNLLSDPQYSTLTSTIDGEDSIYCSTVQATDGSTAIILASQRMLEFMSRVTHIFADGTFCTPACPNVSQVYNLTAMWRWHIIPLAVVLMERRTTSLYKRVYQEIKTASPRFRPTTFYADFEAAQNRAIRDEFSFADWIGCLFHYASAIIQHAKSLGLTALIRNNAVVADIVRYCCVIPLAPQNLMREAHRLIAAMARTTIFYGDLREFFDYIYCTWLTGARYDYVNVCRAESRTNNVSESFNRILQDAMRSRHPNMWDFLNAVKNIEDKAVTDIQTLLNGDSPSRARRASSLANDANIEAWTTDLENNMITLWDFIVNVSEKVITVVDSLIG